MRESGLLFYEYAKIVATFNTNTGKSLVDKRLLERGYSQELIDQLHAKNKSSIKSLNLLLKPGFESLNCEYFSFYYTLYEAYEKGTMPFTGSLVDQPAKIIEVLDTIKSLNGEYQRIELEKQQRENKRKKLR